MEALRTFAGQHGYELAGEYVDSACSGFRSPEKRLSLHQLIADAKEGKFAVVLIWKLDRWARNLADGLRFFGELLACGVEVVSICEHGIDGSPSGELNRNLLLSFAEYFSASHSQNVRRGLHSLFSHGGWLNKIPPYGYRIDASSGTPLIVPAKAEQAVVRRIFALAAAGSSLRDICRELNRRGPRTRHGCAWCAGTVYRILRSRSYLGHRTSRQGSREHSHPALIDERAWAHARASLCTRRNDQVYARPPATPFVLAQFTRCGLCNDRAVGIARRYSPAKLYRYYVCHTRRRYGPSYCAGCPWRKEALEERVLAALRVALLDPVRVRALIVPSAPESATEPIEALMALLRRQRGESPATLARLTAKLAALELRLRPASAAPSPGVVHGVVSHYARALAAGELGKVLDRVSLWPDRVEVRILVPTQPATIRSLSC